MLSHCAVSFAKEVAGLWAD